MTRTTRSSKSRVADVLEWRQQPNLRHLHQANCVACNISAGTNGAFFCGRSPSTTKTALEPSVIKEWEEITAGFEYAPTESFELRLEACVDTSNNRTFVDSNRLTARNDQDSAGVEFAYKFVHGGRVSS
ncbi:MAG TPA: hypothetical protein VF161_02275 [Steroidobacteraceae bacterium]